MGVDKISIMDDAISSGTIDTSTISTDYVYYNDYSKFINDAKENKHTRFWNFTIPKIEDWPKKNNERSKNMMGLYEVNIVNTKENKEVANSIRVIAKDEDKAKMKALTDFCSVVDIDDCLFFVRCIGQWESKKPREVKIVKE